ncbi:MAG: hypothetical protein H6729_06750 [Deltaproteobacteria bacterium]|nr:hypothetical protein [Deltaproteobacteria bacterium]
MVYAAPQCYGFWAQEPTVFGDSSALRYVATAMHSMQAKPGILPPPSEEVLRNRRERARWEEYAD